MVQDLPKVFDEKEWIKFPSLWRELLKKNILVNTKDLSPNQQVYYFFSIKDDGKKIYIKHAMFDDTTKECLSKGFGNWSKEEFKLKFEQK